MVTVTENKVINYSRGPERKTLVEIFCKKGEPKPVDGIMNGSELRELDPETKSLTVYYFDESAANDADKWVPVAYVKYDGPEIASDGEEEAL